MYGPTSGGYTSGGVQQRGELTSKCRARRILIIAIVIIIGGGVMAGPKFGPRLSDFDEMTRPTTIANLSASGYYYPPGFELVHACRIIRQGAISTKGERPMGQIMIARTANLRDHERSNEGEGGGG